MIKRFKVSETESTIRDGIERVYISSCSGKKLTEKGYAKTLNELGFDSIDIVQFAVDIEAAFGLDIPDEVAENFPDLSASGIAIVVNDLLAEKQGLKRPSEIA